MDLGDLIKPEQVIPALRVKSKKQMLQELAQQASDRLGIAQRAIFETLLQRESLGSTGIGRCRDPSRDPADPSSRAPAESRRLG